MASSLTVLLVPCLVARCVEIPAIPSDRRLTFDAGIATSLTRSDLMETRKPVLMHDPTSHSLLKESGFSDFLSLNRSFGREQVLLGDATPFVPGPTKDMRYHSVPDWVGSVLDVGPTLPRLSEPAGREFFLARPELYTNLTNAFAALVPQGFRRSLTGTFEENAEFFREALAEHDYGEPALTLFAGSGPHAHYLHIDYVFGNVLTHLFGAKRIWFYPPEQRELLYLVSPNGGFGGGDGEWVDVLLTRFSPTFDGLPDAERFPLLANATPFAVDLKPGESIFIPCGWAHIVEYFGPAVSVSCTLQPDWLTELFLAGHNWSPRGGCRDFLGDAPVVSKHVDEEHGLSRSEL